MKWTTISRSTSQAKQLGLPLIPTTKLDEQATNLTSSASGRVGNEYKPNEKAMS